MKRLAVACIAAILAFSAAADDPPAPSPDYSRDSLLRLVSEAPEPPPRERNVKHHFGAVEFRALGMDWRLFYLPVAMPLSGSGLRTSSSMPDPFELTGTVYATPAKPWRERRQLRAELRRINRSERARSGQ